MDGNFSKKRLLSLNGIQNTYQAKNDDFLCPICFELISEAYITRCGHTFCHKCIIKCIEVTKKCPKCYGLLPNLEAIFPNFLLNELITKHKLKEDQKQKLFVSASTTANASSISVINDEDSDTLKSFLATESKKLTLPDVKVMLEILTQRKFLLEAESVAGEGNRLKIYILEAWRTQLWLLFFPYEPACNQKLIILAQNRLLHEFLQNLLKQTELQQNLLGKKIKLIKSDLTVVERILKNVQESCPSLEDVDKKFQNKQTRTESMDEENEQISLIKNEMKKLINTIQDESVGGSTSNNSVKTQGSVIQGKEEEGFNVYEDSATNSSSAYQLRKQRMFAHFDDFVKCYYSNRSEDLQFIDSKEKEETELPAQSEPQTECTDPSIAANPEGTPKTLNLFRENLIKFSKFNQLRTLSTLNYSNDTNNMSTIVSSIEFDKDCEYFAVAGVTKRIKIFDYFSAIRDVVVDIKYPINEMVCNSKISCVVWNCYFKEILASSDYEGIVTIWDVETRTRKKVFQEHDKRSWSVDFNEIDTKLLASGSDDARVKLWSLECEHSVATLEVKANVCCVKFNPKSSCHLAFGSADHCVHYYDLRNMKEPLCVFKGHKKAVSYVKFLNTHEIISAGTDGQLKLWDINQPPYCLRSFVGGHINEKNFVGLATNGDYLACGSEDNSLCVYYKGLSRQLFNLKFDLQAQQQKYTSSGGGLFDMDNKNIGSSSSDNNDFVSAVCWRKNTNTIIAGNSRGIIKILELV